jgi:RNA:NAD 2'-phosphotransferase (TPT1/KptA family)
MGRQYVHLSRTEEIALAVGKRHGEPIVLYIDAKTMHDDGCHFYLSENKVWLTDAVPMKYIRVEDNEQPSEEPVILMHTKDWKGFSWEDFLKNLYGTDKG